MPSNYASPLLAGLLRLPEIAALLIVISFLLPLGANLADYKDNPFVVYLLKFDSQSIDFVRTLAPFKLGDYDSARGICVLLAMILFKVFSKLRSYFTPIAITHAVSSGSYSAISNVKSRTELLEVISEAQSRINAIDKKPGSASDNEYRNRLLSVIAEAKSRHEKLQRDLAFLSIDVVGSTQMKVGEDRLKIEMDFRHYKEFINKEIAKFGALTTAWTPDGVMVCYPTANDAIGSAKSVISGLRRFNQQVKTVRAEFRVRCGVNAGRVYYDPLIPMEEMSDRVIDIAGHMQKYAAPDSVFASPAIVKMLAPLPREGFRPANETVDGLEVYQWSA